MQGAPRQKDRYVVDASVYGSVNRLTNEAPEVIHRFFETPPPKKQHYTVAISLVRGQAGAAGVTPPDTGQRFYPFPPIIQRSSGYYPPGSAYTFPEVLRPEYDPFGGGAFFSTRAPYTTGRTPGFSGNFRGPQILLPEADQPLRHWVDFTRRPSALAYTLGSNFTSLRQLQDATSVGEGTSKFWPTTPRYRPAGPTYLVDGGKVMATPKTLIPNSTGGYDIYHYYV